MHLRLFLKNKGVKKTSHIADVTAEDLERILRYFVITFMCISQSNDSFSSKIDTAVSDN